MDFVKWMLAEMLTDWTLWVTFALIAVSILYGLKGGERDE